MPKPPVKPKSKWKQLEETAAELSDSRDTTIQNLAALMVEFAKQCQVDGQRADSRSVARHIQQI